MAINYKVTRCRNPKSPDELFLKGTAVKTDDYDFDDLAEDIAESTTVTKADCLAVLAAMKPKIKKALLAGRRVVLNDLGSFVIGLQGKCYPATSIENEEFSPSAMIKKWSIKFRPEARLRGELDQGITLKRVSSEYME